MLSDAGFMNTLQMEEDVGIVDPDGLLAYAAYFRDALALRPSLEPGSQEDELFFVLQYKIGTHVLEGRLPVSLWMNCVMLTLHKAFLLLLAAESARGFGCHSIPQHVSTLSHRCDAEGQICSHCNALTELLE